MLLSALVSPNTPCLVYQIMPTTDLCVSHAQSPFSPFLLISPITLLFLSFSSSIPLSLSSFYLLLCVALCMDGVMRCWTTKKQN